MHEVIHRLGSGVAELGTALSIAATAVLGEDCFNVKQ
jgi:hypothetical protein